MSRGAPNPLDRYGRRPFFVLAPNANFPYFAGTLLGEIPQKLTKSFFVRNINNMNECPHLSKYGDAHAWVDY